MYEWRLYPPQAKSQKNLNVHQLTNEYIVCCVHAMKRYLAMIRNEVLVHVSLIHSAMNLENTRLSERSQTHKIHFV